MANGHGGARIGAGKKKKPLAEKILDGNPGKRALTIVEFPELPDMEGEPMPPPRDFLSARQKNGQQTIAVNVYKKTWEWRSFRTRLAQPIAQRSQFICHCAKLTKFLLPVSIQASDDHLFAHINPAAASINH